MAEKPPASPEPNPIAGRIHAREKFSQIYAPIILAGCGLAMLLVVAVILFTRNLTGQLSILADGLLICFTLVPCLVPVLVLFFVMAFMAFGLNQLNRQVPAAFAHVQRLADRLHEAVVKALSVAARPVVAVNAWLARGERYVGSLGICGEHGSFTREE